MIEEAKKLVFLASLERRKEFLRSKLSENQEGRNPQHPLAEYEALCWALERLGE